MFRSLPALVLIALAGGCAAPGREPGVPAASVSGEVVVFAGSSLTEAFTDLATKFEHAHPGVRVTLSFGASSQLRAQLEQGARADVFASADQAQMDAARRAGAIEGSDRVFARNRLVLIVPRDNPRQIGSVRDLAQDGLKFVTAQPNVPIGQYTTALLERASRDPAYGADFMRRVEGNTVSREDNVRQIVAKVQLGEADAGIVYASDVTPQVRDHLQQISVPDALQTLATYPIAVTRGANSTGAEAFVTFVLSPTGQDILAAWGFMRGEN